MPQPSTASDDMVWSISVMRFIRSILLGGLALALLAPGEIFSGAPPPARPPGPLARFSAEQRARLLAGEAVFEYRQTGEGRGHGQATILINAPLETCFTIFSALDRQSQYFPRKTKSEIVERQGNRILLRNEFDFYLARIEYYSLYTVDPRRHRFDFELDQSYPHNVDESAGYFQFEAVDERRTLFTYAATKLDVGVAVPDFIKQYLTSRDLPALAVNVKKRIESGGQWTDK